MPYTCISIEETFPAAHYTNPRLSPAGTLHGHNWKVKVTVCKEGKSGWVIDAVKLRELVSEIVDPFRFSLIVPEQDARLWLQRNGLRDMIEENIGVKVRIAVLPYPLVSAETMAHYVHSRLSEELTVDCLKVEVEESPGEVATYDECI
ncbi:hypothetical protein EYM_00070 [Ignicoccus islandicus DSM 13165]|uniref:6-pyruvoyl tetrahydrobiopterin synthase n=1 Tax=Ignicoccus islandicus DSM 13165 TaxID=940295 RepID=A0A0U3E2E2_9CREN|nr:6-carboxytetrahydropterin synthase [Ignicoccus islandicus]ALU12091.1 hypothetical protein EYM_00070 [Ignicoccus islandicus DSM 13165]